ncbi:carbohydrate-binding domain-containing protein [Solwaraspora sp. WMMD791]|uniref:carbohydrate-binding domain-containing protein n=1 Tax=Solwaraspora sp. WMMD791 TaxID=3016086 RepID=UPI00249A175F|nr:carbohydrate-binding domain-containing protein [Solwaraspora sp. WMMD791]WFE26033.1 carbohydrate-binding domain-containing protein [Solwaraspora sp. WMMD791]
MRRIPLRAVLPAGLAIALIAGPLQAPAVAQATVPITLTGASATSPSANVTIAGRAVTITAPGTYEITGTLNDGYLNVDTSASGIVNLILNGAVITNSSNAPLQVTDADEAVITLAAGTTSRLTDAATYVYPDPSTDEPNAALFSRADLRITGSGALTVRGNAYDGITSKDGLVIDSGTITVDAVDDGIRGKDFLDVTGGNLDVTAGGDGIKSDDTEADRGRLTITNGTVRVDAGDDAIKGENTVDISGGTVTVTNSYEAIESRQVTISGGTVNVTARDDAINAVEDGYGDFDVAPNAFVRFTGGTTIVSSSIDGVDSNGTVTFAGGTVVVSGPSSGSPGEGAIDSNGAVHFTGGTMLGAGSTALAVLSLPPTSGQGWVAPQLSSSQPANTLLHLVSGGQVLASYRSPKNFREVVFSSNRIQHGQTYEVYLGGSLTGSTIAGMATTGGSIAGATRLMTVTAGQYRGGLVGWPPGPGWPPPPQPTPTPPPPNPTTPPPNPTTPPPGGGGCTATYSVVGQWQGGFQGDVRVTAGSSAINGWRVTWTFANGQTISQSWNATINASGSAVTATNVSFNGALGAGASTTFGFLGTWNGSNATPALTCTAT